MDFPAIFACLDAHSNPAPLSVEIEFTKDGAKDIDEVDEAMAASAEYLRKAGFTL